MGELVLGGLAVAYHEEDIPRNVYRQFLVDAAHLVTIFPFLVTGAIRAAPASCWEHSFSKAATSGPARESAAADDSVDGSRSSSPTIVLAVG